MKKMLQKPEHDSLFRRLYYFRWYQCDTGLKDQKKTRSINQEKDLSQQKQPVEVLICLVEGIYDALSSYCEFISQVLQSDYNYKENSISLLEFYNT